MKIDENLCRQLLDCSAKLSRRNRHFGLYIGNGNLHSYASRSVEIAAIWSTTASILAAKEPLMLPYVH